MQNKHLNFFSQFEKIFCINLDRQKDRWNLVREEFIKIGIEKKVFRFSAFDVPMPHVGCALSQRSIIQQAKNESLQNVLILEDDISIISQHIPYLPDNLPKNWQLLYGSGLCCFQDVPYLSRYNEFLYSGCGISSGHFVGYNQSVYDIFLSSIPGDYKSMVSFVNQYKAFDSYLSRYIQESHSTYILTYPICTQGPGFSNNQNKYVDRSQKILNRFEKIKSLPAFYVYSAHFFRPVLRKLWKFLSFFRYYLLLSCSKIKFVIRRLFLF